MVRRKLTAEEKKVMRQIVKGADIWGRYEAGIIRYIEREFPGLVTVTKAMNAPEDGAKQQPYFGAILTLAGLKAIGVKKEKQ